MPPFIRPRRLRTTPAMRAMVAETRVAPAQLMMPVFVREGITEPVEIKAMPGQYQHTTDSIKKLAAQLAEAGVGGIDLFGVPADEQKDETGSIAWDPEGILNRGITAVREEVGDALVVCADTCLDEFTSHGHCGVLTEDGRVDNDPTLELYAKMAVSQARAGAHMVSPSGMMDGQVEVIRQALDQEGFQDVAIMAYSAKYASAFFGPFREAVSCNLKGDRKTYQQDPANRIEGLREALLDISEGADIVMVKPASHYLDVLADVAGAVDVPVAAYQVSGEYAMVEAAAANGWIDRERAIAESLVSIARAGASVILTYWALEYARRGK
ncbi:porphobilinogen synthase [Winkia sp. ACRQY]|uniref:porphobilinogen synthase n=1 Tax=Winkia TaxID=2692118 RepID=UPI0009F41532|nr:MULTISPECIES: porphobilinogen synthase [Winkia]MBS5947242.1 porphobilinogen synthase [Winkia neuii]MCG7302699.1 porphobilinogen synthase [Winkia sp. ACRQY]MDK6241516.1 porphobilinogen synthase [Winkia sp. UMB10116]MDU6112269.1 porphobilinogen synthase [Winkia neuii]WIK90585.1 porphobilinogen synthase [Winkia neuii]